jgi:energy-converting hydrogenase Eha subunit E
MTTKIIFGAIFIGLGSIIRPETTDLLMNIMNITSPVALIIGVLLIFDSFRKNIK